MDNRSVLVISEQEGPMIISVGEQGPAGVGGGAGGVASEPLAYNGELLFTGDGDIVVTET